VNLFYLLHILGLGAQKSTSDSTPHSTQTGTHCYLSLIH
jgi:hypothetical protein